MKNSPSWNLSEIYRGAEDPELYKDLNAAYVRAVSFCLSYKDKIDDTALDARTLCSAIKEYESIHEQGLKPKVFAFLIYSSNTLDNKYQSLFQDVSEKWHKILNETAFFILELTALPETLLSELASHPCLSDYRHFLLRLIPKKPYTLSLEEEKIIKTKELSGKQAFALLYDELIGSLSFPVEINGKIRQSGIDQIRHVLQLPDPLLREKTLDIYLHRLGEHEIVFKNIINALMLDYHQEERIRGFSSPMHNMHLLNEVNEEMIETMMMVTEENYPLIRRYFRTKAELLGLKRLKVSDIFAPLQEETFHITFKDATEIVLDALKGLDPVFYSIASDLFKKKRIDAETRKGKLNGAFCKCGPPSQAPYISMAYSGNIKDIITLAHELGHGIHYRLASKQSYLNFEPRPVIAETASTFFELVINAHLLEKDEFQDWKYRLVASQIEGFYITIFRQNVLTRFELSMHNLRRDHRLTGEEISNIWWEENYRLFGETVEITPACKWGWISIPHFIHLPFYCYSYIFGNLLAIILYQNYIDYGWNFLEKVIEILSGGSSRPSIQILNEIGLDPQNRSFWEKAFDYIGRMVDFMEKSKR